MQTRTAKSFLHLSIIASIMILMASCTGGKSTTSYPVAQLTPERAGLPQPLRKAGSHKAVRKFQITDLREDNRLDFTGRMPTQSDVQLTNDDIRKCSVLKRNRPAEHIENPDYYAIHAYLESKPAEGLIKKDQSAYRTKQNNPVKSLLPVVKTGEEDKPAKARKDPKEMNGFGIVSLVTGIASIILPYLAPVAIVFGAIGLNKRLRGLAIAGMVLGIVTIVFYIAVIFLFLIALGGEGI